MTQIIERFTTSDIVNAILTAEDYDEDKVVAAIKQRRATQRLISTAAKLQATKIGTQVALTGLSPKYLNGLRGKVTALRGKRVIVDLDEGSQHLLRISSAGRFSNPVNVPVDCTRTV